MRVLDRYVIKEFITPFLACVAGFTVMLLSGIIYELTELIVARQMSVTVVLQLLAYKLPMVVVVSLPVAALFAALLALGRLAKDSELTVMRVTGCSFPRLALPALIVAVIISGITFGLNEAVVPQANHKAEDLYRQAIFRDALPQIEANVFLQGPQERTFYVGEVDRTKRKLRHIMIFEKAEPRSGSPYPALLTASEGTYEDGQWILRNGVRRTFDQDGYVSEEVAFKTLEVPMVQGEEQLFGEQKSTSEMTRQELGELIQLYRRSGINMNRFVVDYHAKLAQPLTAFVWVLLAAPLAVPAVRSGKFYGVVVSILVAFIYYVAEAVSHSLGGNGVIPPFLAAWLPVALFGLSGITFLARADHL